VVERTVVKKEMGRAACRERNVEEEQIDLPAEHQLQWPIECFEGRRRI